MGVRLKLSAPIQGQKHRTHEWINTETLVPMYGVQVNVAKGIWAHVVVDGAVYFANNKTEATMKAREWSRD